MEKPSSHQLGTASEAINEPSNAELSRQIRALSLKIEAIQHILQAIMLSGGQTTASGQEIFIRKIEKLLAQAVSASDDAPASGDDAPTGDDDALTSDVNALTDGVDALTGGDHAPTSSADAPTSGANAPASVDDALTKHDDAPAKAAKASRRHSKGLPWENIRPESYKAGTHSRYRQSWQKALPATLLNHIRQDYEHFGGLREGGAQAVAALYLVLYHHAPLQRTAIAGRMQLHEDHLKRYFKRIRHAGHLLSQRRGPGKLYELTEKGRAWVEEGLK